MSFVEELELERRAGTAAVPGPQAPGVVTVRYANGAPLLIDGQPVRVPAGTHVVPTRSAVSFAGEPVDQDYLWWRRDEVWPWRQPLSRVA